MAGGPITAASDVFSLACIAFELITGRRPVPSGDAVIVDTAAIRSADAAALAEVFARVLSGTPDDRHSSALAFAAALKHALTGAPLQPDAEAESPRPRRARRRVAPDGESPRLPSFLEEYEGVVPQAATGAVADEQPSAPVVTEPVVPSVVEPVASPAVEPEVVAVVEPAVVPVSEPQPAPVEQPVTDAGPLDAVLLRSRAPTSDVRPSNVPIFAAYSDDTSPAPIVAALRRHLVPLLGVLAVTFALGFTVGYFAAPQGGRGAPPPAKATSVAPPAASAAGALPTAAPPAPLSHPAPPTDTPAAAGTKTTEPARPAGETGGSLVVASRPSGARVLIDGHAVGKTPMTLRDVAPGSHKLRLELAGYRAWSSTVRVAAGRQRKIAASLERRPGG